MGRLPAVPLLECGGLKPILPFLGGGSDAACRVVTHNRDALHCVVFRHAASRLRTPHTAWVQAAGLFPIPGGLGALPSRRGIGGFPSLRPDPRTVASGVYGVCSDVACRVAIRRASPLIARSSVPGCGIYYQRVALFIIRLNWQMIGFLIFLYFSVITICLGSGHPARKGWAVWP